MKKYIVAIAVAVGLFCSSQAKAGGYSLADLGISSGTNNVAMVSGAGTLFAVQIESGTLGDYVICWDSAAAVGSFSNQLDKTTSGAPRIGFAIVSTFTVSAVAPVSGGLPVAFTNGIVCNKSASGDRVKVYYTGW